MSVTANCPTSYCDEELMPYVLPECEKAFLGGSSKAYVFNCGSVPTEFSKELIDQLVQENKAQLLPIVVVSLGDPSPIEGQPTSGCRTPKIITQDRSVIIKDYNVTPAIQTFWNDRIGKAIGALMFNECEEDRFTFVSPKNGLEVNATRFFPETNTEQQYFEITMTYRGLLMDQIYDDTYGIF